MFFFYTNYYNEYDILYIWTMLHIKFCKNIFGPRKSVLDFFDFLYPNICVTDGYWSISSSFKWRCTLGFGLKNRERCCLNISAFSRKLSKVLYLKGVYYFARQQRYFFYELFEIECKSGWSPCLGCVRTPWKNYSSLFLNICWVLLVPFSVYRCVFKFNVVVNIFSNYIPNYNVTY